MWETGGIRDGSLPPWGFLQSLGAAQEKAKGFAGKFSSGRREMSSHGLITG